MTFSDIIAGTPWWVWAVFVYVVVIGIANLKDRTAWLPRLLVVPVVIGCISLLSLRNNYGVDVTSLGLWSVGLLIGGLIGFWGARRRGVHVVDTAKLTLKIPGSRASLAILLSFFAVKYTRGMLFAFHPEYRLIPQVMVADLLLAGFFVGFLAGRGCFYVSKILQAKKA